MKRQCTSLQRHKWLQTKMHTTTDTIFCPRVWFGVLVLDMEVFIYWLVKNFSYWEGGYQSLHSVPNGSYHKKVHEKLCHEMVSEVVCIFVGSHWCLWKNLNVIVWYGQVLIIISPANGWKTVGFDFVPLQHWWVLWL